MFGIINYWVFLVSGILLNLAPGPDTLYILGRSISQGRKAGVVSALGISTGAFLHTTLAALGLSIVLAQSALAFNTIKYAGVAYLIFLGIRTLVTKSGAIAVRETAAEEPRKIYWQGVFTNLFNPKVALFFLAFLPQFVDPANAYGPLPFILLGLTFITTGTIWCLIVAGSASFATRQLRKNQKVSVILNKLTGILFIGLGLNLIRAKANG